MRVVGRDVNNAATIIATGNGKKATLVCKRL
jgi:hypothetical protein